MNYSTEIVLNPIYQNSDFDINPINLDVGLDLNLIDFSIDVLMGSNIIINPIDERLPIVLYQDTAPVNPKTGDIWVSTITLIQYQWIGAWVNLNLQSLINL